MFFKKIIFKFLNGIVRIRSSIKKYLYFSKPENLSFHYTVEVKYPENIILGRNIKIGPFSTLGAYKKIHIADNVTISKGVFIETAGLDIYNKEEGRHIGKEIYIGKDTWIGANTMILGGVSIGENCVIAAGSIITKDIPNNYLVMLNNKLIKKLNEE